MTFEEFLVEYERNYKKEYDKYQSSKSQKKQRAMRNKARRESGLKKGDGKEVDHIIPLSKGGSNGKENRRIVSRYTNRSKGTKNGNVEKN